MEEIKDMKTRDGEIAQDPVTKAMFDTIDAQAKWTAPCTFNRTNAMPLDPKACFDTYADLDAYVQATNAKTGGTGYPGMNVAVINKNDPQCGPYILTSDGEKLIATKICVASGSGAEIYWLNEGGEPYTE